MLGKYGVSPSINNIDIEYFRVKFIRFGNVDAQGMNFKPTGAELVLTKTSIQLMNNGKH